MFDPVGSGGQGLVYRAKWKGAEVAVKTLKDVKGSEALLAEASALCELQHPHVVRVFGFCTTPDLAVVMEYVAWGSLTHWITANKGKHDDDTVRQRVTIAQGIVSGMAFIHEQGFVHCDLKPGNVLLAFDGVRHTPKISDLGLAVRARALGPGGVRGGARQWGSIVCRPRGTPGFMAPELHAARSEGHGVTVTQKVDVYSFGVLLVALFVGDITWGEVLPAGKAELAARLKQLALAGVAPIVPVDTQVRTL